MAEESLTVLATRQACLKAEKLLKRLAENWVKKIEGYKGKGLPLKCKYSVYLSFPRVCLMIECEPTEWLIFSERRKLATRKRPRC